MLKTLRELKSFISEAKAANNDIAKHEGLYIKNLLIKLLDPNVLDAGLDAGAHGENVIKISDRKKLISNIKNYLLTYSSNGSKLKDELNKLDNLDNIDDISSIINKFTFDLKEEPKENAKNLNQIFADDCCKLYERSDNGVKEIDTKVQFNRICKDIIKGDGHVLNAQDREILAILAINSKYDDSFKLSEGDNINNEDIDKILKCVGEDPKSVKNDKRTYVINLIKTYKAQKQYFAKIADAMDPLNGIDKSEYKDYLPFYKPKYASKDELSTDWTGKNRTPKTDIISKNGKLAYSLKEDKSQFASGGFEESISNIKIAIKQSGKNIDEYKEILDNIDKLWDKGKNVNVSNEIKNNILLNLAKILKDKDICKQFYRISITGEHKYKDGSGAIANRLFCINRNDPSKSGTIDPDFMTESMSNALHDLIQKHENDNDGLLKSLKSFFSVSKKSSGTDKSSFLVLRASTPGEDMIQKCIKQYINKHDIYEPDDDDDSDKDDGKGNVNKKEEIIDKETGKKINTSVQHRTGPRGGHKYRYKKIDGKWSEWYYE